MAGDWIKMTTNLHEKPEVIAISGELGIDRFAVVGRLHRFWAWFDSHSSDGHAKGVTDIFIDELVGHNGFSNALRKVDWLIDRSGSLSVPHFDRHNGQSAKKRAESTERKRRSRQVSQEKGDKCHAKGVTEVRPEKRREEKSNIPPKSPKGGKAPFAQTLINEIPEHWSGKRKNAAEEWAIDKQGRGQARQRFQSVNAWKACLKRMELYSDDVLSDAIQQAIASGWQGWEQDSVKEKMNSSKGKPRGDYRAQGISVC